MSRWEDRTGIVLCSTKCACMRLRPPPVCHFQEDLGSPFRDTNNKGPKGPKGLAALFVCYHRTTSLGLRVAWFQGPRRLGQANHAGGAAHLRYPGVRARFDASTAIGTLSIKNPCVAMDVPPANSSRFGKNMILPSTSTYIAREGTKSLPCHKVAALHVHTTRITCCCRRAWHTALHAVAETASLCGSNSRQLVSSGLILGFSLCICRSALVW